MLSEKTCCMLSEKNLLEWNNLLCCCSKQYTLIFCVDLSIPFSCLEFVKISSMKVDIQEGRVIEQIWEGRNTTFHYHILSVTSVVKHQPTNASLKVFWIDHRYQGISRGFLQGRFLSRTKEKKSFHNFSEF